MIKKIEFLKIITIIITIALTMLACYANKTYASSFKFDVTASKTRLKAGESTVVTMKISDIVDVNNLGINALESILDYDTNVLEVVTQNDMTGVNNWTITYNQQKNNFLVSNIISGIKETQEIGTIKFKIKDNVKPTKTIIKFKEVRSNDGTNLMRETDKQIELTIYEDENTEDGLEILKSENAVNNGRTAISKLPKTGVKLTVPILISVLSLFTLISYVKYKIIDK